MDGPMETLESLTRYALSECDAMERAGVDALLSRSPDARTLLEHVRSAIATLQGYDAHEAPAELVRRVKDLVRTAPAPEPAERWWDTLARVVASLVFDGRQTAVVPGFRGGGETQHLSYSSPLGELDMQLTPVESAPGRWRVRGQVDATGGGAGEVVFLRAGDADPSARAPADARGEFHVEIAGGTYRVVCRVGDRAMEVPDVRI